MKKGVGLAVKMNPLLKPFLLGLQERYTQYQLENILAMKSVYAIRIYELLMKEQMTRFIPADGDPLYWQSRQYVKHVIVKLNMKRSANLKARL